MDFLMPSADVRATALAVAFHLVARQDVSQALAASLPGESKTDALVYVRKQADLIGELAKKLLTETGAPGR